MKKLLCSLFFLSALLFSLSACASPSALSAYDLAVRHGFSGSEEEWLESLNGAPGEKGEIGERGADGKDGRDGALWFSGEGAPAAETGKEGDFYLDFSDGGVYERTNSGWQKRGDIRYEGYIEYVEITFDPNGGSLPEGAESAVKIRKGDVCDLPVPQRGGYTFLGWFCGEGANRAQADALTVFSRDAVLTAAWRRQYRISLNGGSDAVTGYQVRISGSYDGSADAALSLFIEKDGIRYAAEECGALSRYALQMDEGDAGAEIFGFVVFSEPGDYRVVVCAEEAGSLAEASFLVTIS